MLSSTLLGGITVLLVGAILVFPASVLASGTSPSASAVPSGGILPRPPAMTDNLLVADIRNFPPDLALLMISLQGVVNRQTARIFLITGGNDQMWANWLQERGDVQQLTKLDTIAALQLIHTFRTEISGIVVVDPAVPATVNVATMLSGLDQLIIAYPSFAEKYAHEYDLPIVADLRGRFANNAEAYSWAFTNLWPRLNHFALAMLHPECLAPRDIIIQQKLWVWWQSGSADGGSIANRMAELQTTMRVLQSSPVNIPVFGYPWHGDGVGLGENGGVTLFSQYGKFLLPADLAGNLSVHRSAQPTRLPLNPPVSVADAATIAGKTYASVIFSDGDNLQALLNYFPRYWADPQNRQVPIGWTISPSAWEMMPAVVDYLAQHRLPGDYFVAAVSGIGYVYLEEYGRSTPDPEGAVREFLALTNDYMNKMGLTMIWPMATAGPVKDAILQQYATQLDNLTAIFPDYGQKISDYAKVNQIVRVGNRNIPVFHAVSGRKEYLAADLHAFLTSAPKPAFIQLFLCNWFYNQAELAALGSVLGSDYLLVRPDELARLYLSAQ